MIQHKPQDMKSESPLVQGVDRRPYPLHYFSGIISFPKHTVLNPVQQGTPEELPRQSRVISSHLGPCEIIRTIFS